MPAACIGLVRSGRSRGPSTSLVRRSVAARAPLGRRSCAARSSWELLEGVELFEAHDERRAMVFFAIE